MNVRVELWELPGPYWRMPLRVVWYAEMAEVRVGYGVPITAKMRAVAEEKLLTVGSLKRNAIWISEEDLNQIARKSTADDAQDIIEWMPSRQGIKVESRYEAIDFIQSYCGQHYAMIRDPLLAEAVWFSFLRFMMHWLVNENKTVDLVFAKMNAFLLRKNWQGACGKYERDQHRKHLITYCNVFNPDPQDIVARGVADYMLSGSVSAFDEKNRVAMYNLDVHTTEEWSKFCAKLEQHRKSNGESGNNYMNGVLCRMKRQLPRVIESYARYLEEANRPGIDVHRSVLSRAQGQRLWAGGKCTPIKAAGPCDASAVLHDAVAPRPAETVAATDAGVPEVPDLQPGMEDVRHAG